MFRVEAIWGLGLKALRLQGLNRLGFLGKFRFQGDFDVVKNRRTPYQWRGIDLGLELTAI